MGERQSAEVASKKAKQNFWSLLIALMAANSCLWQVAILGVIALLVIATILHSARH